MRFNYRFAKHSFFELPEKPVNVNAKISVFLLFLLFSMRKFNLCNLKGNGQATSSQSCTRECLTVCFVIHCSTVVFKIMLYFYKAGTFLYSSTVMCFSRELWSNFHQSNMTMQSDMGGSMMEFFFIYHIVILSLHLTKVDVLCKRSS